MIKLKIVLALLLLGGFATYAQEIMTMNKALEIAALNSPDLQKSSLSLQRSQSRVDAQRASQKSVFRLQVNPVEYSLDTKYQEASASWDNVETFSSGLDFSIDQPIVATGGALFFTNGFDWQYNNNELNPNSEPRTFNNDARFGFTQPIFFYNQLKYDLMGLELNYENTLLSYLLQRLSLERLVAIAFYDVYENQMSLDISKSELYNNQSSYDIIKNKVEGGLTALEELYQAEVNLASSKSSVSNAEVTLENSKDQFKMQVGMDLDADFMAMTSVEVTPIFIELNEGVSYALNNRMELRQREIEIEQNQFALVVTKNSQTESFNGSVTGSIGLTGLNPVFGNVYSNPTRTPRFSISLNIPLYDWGKRKNEIAAAQADIDMSEIDFEQEKRDIIINVRQVYRSLDNIKIQIEIAKLNVKNSQLTYDINAERYRNGDITGMDLNLFQTQLSSKKMDLTNSLIDYRIELLNLKIQTLYDFELNQSIVPEELISSTENK